jgi:hypothetical protein
MMIDSFKGGAARGSLPRLAVVFLLSGAAAACGDNPPGDVGQLDNPFGTAGAGAGGSMVPMAGMTGIVGMTGGAGGSTTPPPPPPPSGTAGMGGTGGMAPDPDAMAGMGGEAGAAGEMATSGTGGGGGSDVPDMPDDHCLAGITDFAGEGPFDFMAMPQGSVKMWIPMVPDGCKVPVIHLANGTGGTCSAYQNLLNRLASHGFLTTCYESGSTGAGRQGLEAIQSAYENFPDLADTKIGSTGHSQGGQASFIVLQFAEEEFGDSYTYAGLAMEPASGFGQQPAGTTWEAVYAKIKSPMFMFSGTADILVSAAWVRRAFTALDDSVEAYNWSAVGAVHVPTPQSETIEVGIPWFRWKLLGDKKACEAFKALPMGANWRVTGEQNPSDC